MAIIPKGHEPANVKKRIDTLFPKLNEAYPDKVIVSLQRDHKKWDETAREISRQLGYDSKNAFLIAYGYTIEKGESGRPSNDHTAIIDELKKRYPNGAPFAKIGELQDANPDLANKFKTLANKSKELFGMTLADYFKSIGLLGGSDHKKQLDDLIAELMRRYPTGSAVPNTLAQLKEDNPDLMTSRLVLINEIFGVTPSEYLCQIGLLDPLSPAEKLDALIKELQQRYQNKRPAGTLRQLKEENTDLPVNSAGNWAEACGKSLLDTLRDVGLVDAKSRIQQAIEEAAKNKPNPADGISFAGRYFVYTNNAYETEDTKYGKIASTIIPRGGQLRESVTKKTDYLIVDGYNKAITHKYREARKLIAQGLPIQILSVKDFLKQTAEYDSKTTDGSGFVEKDGVLIRYAGEDCNLAIPEHIKAIGDYAFDGNETAERITIPVGVTRIGKYAFKGCTNLREVTLPDTLTFIGASAFVGCENLMGITIPHKVVSIEKGTFRRCTSLNEVILPDELRRICALAFLGCDALRHIRLPKNLEIIGSAAFSRCTNLESVL